MTYDFDRQCRRVLYALVPFSLAACSAQSPESQQDSGVCETCAGSEAGATTDAAVDGARPDASIADAETADAKDGSTDDASDGASDGATDGETGAGPLCAAPGCATGQTMCSGICVSNDNPAYGCGSSACHACSLPQAEPTCTANACAIAHCQPGWADCNGDASDGCEADLSSPATCGACGTRCSGASNLCTPTGCVSACTPPLTLCTDRCVNLATDPNHCGSCSGSTMCGSESSFPACNGGQCGVTCFAGYTDCSGTCVDLTRDANNCGTCGHECPQYTNAAASCSASMCQPTCESGWTACGSACVTTQTDAANCGACGHACGTDEVCAASECKSLTSLQLATNVTVNLFALDATALYWTDGVSTVSSVPIAGGAVTVLAQSQAKPLGIAVDDTYVYWSNNLGASVMRTAKDGSGSPQLVSAATTPSDLAVDATYVYWIDGTNDTVAKVLKGGGTASVALTARANAGLVNLIGSPLGPLVLEYESPADSSQIFDVSTGWAATTGNVDTTAIAQDGSNVYWNPAPPFGGPSCGLESAALSTGAANGALAPSCSSTSLTPVAANACGVFVAPAGPTPNQALMLIRHAGGVTVPYMPTVINEAVDAAIADDAFLYYSYEQSIYKLPMP